MPDPLFEWPKLLLVEVDGIYRNLLAFELRAFGLDVIECRVAMEALDRLDLEPSISCAVINLEMPPNTLTGLGLARMMLNRNPKARVILTNSSRESYDPEDVKLFGRILRKDPDAAVLARRIFGRLGIRLPIHG